jgi:peptide/nickel transport system substrate-binding protein
MKIHRKRSLGFILAASLVVAGCGGGSDSSTTDTAASEAGTQDAAATTEESAATVCEGEPTREQTLVVGPWQTYDAIPNPENFNIYKAIGGVNHQREIGLKGLYEALFLSNLNTGEEIPWLAESYEYNADFTEITVKMRAGTEWSDGVALTAEDVKFTLEMLRDNAPDLDYSSIYAEWLDSVTVPDPLTAVIKLKKPGPRWFKQNLGLGHENHQVIVPKHIWEGQDPVTFTNFDLAKGWPVGSGPYKLVESTSRQQIMDRNDDWWGAKTGFMNLPAPCRVTMVPTGAEEPRGQMYQSNQIDYGLALQRKTLEAVMAANDKIVSWNAEGPVWGAADGCGQNFKFDLSQKPWDDINIRLAVNYAIDRQQLSELGYAGAYPGNDVPFSSYLSSTWLTPEVKAVIAKYDRITPSAEKVAEYMGKSGYSKNAKGMWEKGGQTVKISVTGGSWIP